MGKGWAILLAALAVAIGAGVGAVLLGMTGDDDEPEQRAAPTREDPLLVGFMDDVSFRWSPKRAVMLDRAHAAGGRLIRAPINWSIVAPERPKPGAPPFEEALLHEVDELVDNTAARNMDVMFTITGTPAWANGGQGPNVAPTDLDDLREFSQALAARYPTVRHYSIWNEPNIQLFLSPQFDEQGRSVAPATYAAMYRAAYEGIKASSPDALVAIGETSSNGRDKPSPASDIQDRHSPGRFAQLVAKADPDLEFDAWAHHPYPVQTGTPPDEVANWPNVTLPMLDQFGKALDGYFEREDIPLWITELGYEVAPAEPRGVPEDVHAEYAAESLELAAASSRVDLFVWFAFADDETNEWQSGLLDGSGAERPAYASFAEAVREQGR